MRCALSATVPVFAKCVELLCIHESPLVPIALFLNLIYLHYVSTVGKLDAFGLISAGLNDVNEFALYLLLLATLESLGNFWS